MGHRLWLDTLQNANGRDPVPMSTESTGGYTSQRGQVSTCYYIRIVFPCESSIGYCQVIEASPTELPTVYTVLQRSLQMAQQLRQHDVIVIFNQAIYAKALEVRWHNKDQF